MSTRVFDSHHDRDAAFDKAARNAAMAATTGTPQRALLLGWIWLGVSALLAAGLLALLLAMARTPWASGLLPDPQFFRMALVAHVDLSVLVWFVAGAALLWTLHAPTLAATAASRAVLNADVVALALVGIGAAMVCIAPLAGIGQPIMNNYVPVLDHPWFLVGLGAVAGGLVLKAATLLPCIWARADHRAPSCATLPQAISALTAVIAIACIAVSAYRMPAGIGGEYYYDLLFWGGGHVLQFMHTGIFLVALVTLLEGAGGRLLGSHRLHAALLCLALAPVVVVPWLYGHAIDSREHILGFTELMRLGGTASIPMLLLLAVSLRPGVALTPSTRPLRSSLVCAISLFAGGGLLGFVIQGSNTVIPAHYHGAIVGITMAYMGVVYLLLPRLGRPLTLPRIAAWQPYVYGIGQIIHVTALAFTGGHGAPRKTTGGAQGLDSAQEVIGMGLMGLGGLLAVAGGVLFVVVVLTALLATRRQPGDASDGWLRRRHVTQAAR